MTSRAGGEEMLRALAADVPAPEHRADLMTFGRFVGSWALDVIYYETDGRIRRRSRGEWHFGWVLEGRAIQDVWMIPPRADRPAEGPPAGEYGASLRFFDPRIDAWRSTWIGPVNGYVLPFIARQVGDEVVLERTEDDGTLVRWIFGDITPDSFRWRAVRSVEGQKSWGLDQEMFAIRI